MGDRVLLDMTPEGTAEYLHFNADGELEAIEWTDDSQAILDHNARLRNDGTNGYGKTREWKRVASIPFALLRQWEVDLGLPPDSLQHKEMMPLLLKKIKDPDWKQLRTDK